MHSLGSSPLSSLSLVPFPSTFFASLSNLLKFNQCLLLEYLATDRGEELQQPEIILLEGEVQLPLFSLHFLTLELGKVPVRAGLLGKFSGKVDSASGGVSAGMVITPNIIIGWAGTTVGLMGVDFWIGGI